MIALELIQRIWSLIPPPNLDGSVNLRELDEVSTLNGFPLLAVDADGKRHLLITAPHTTDLIEDRSSAGVHLLADLWGSTIRKQRYVDFMCVMPHLNDVFDLMVYDVLSELSIAVESPDSVCQRILSRWREMLTPEPKALPSQSALVGLYGELTLLRQLTRINPSAIHAWTGPDNGKYDFYAETQAVEVKTSLQRQGITPTIHGHDQLEEPPNGELYLMSFKAEEVPNGGENLFELVNSIVTLGVRRFDLYTSLMRLNISPETLTLTAGFRLRIMASALYIVNGDFPRITTNSFVGGRLPRGVIALTYQIDLSVPPPVPLDEEQAANVLKAFAENIR